MLWPSPSPGPDLARLVTGPDLAHVQLPHGLDLGLKMAAPGPPELAYPVPGWARA